MANDKHSSTALAFLNEYLPNRSYANSVYEVWDEQQELTFETEIALLEFLATTDHFIFNLAFYPNNKACIYRNVQLYYNKDNSLICGINIYQDSSMEDNLLSNLKLFLKSSSGYISYHVPPCRTKLSQ